MASKKPARAKATTRKKPTAATKVSTKTPNPEGSESLVRRARADLERAREQQKNVFLAGLGLYGIAYEEAQAAYDQAQQRLRKNREKTNDLFEDLIKRGEAVEKQAKELLADVKVPKVKLPEADCLQSRLDKARDSFNLLKRAVSRSEGSAA